MKTTANMIGKQVIVARGTWEGMVGTVSSIRTLPKRVKLVTVALPGWGQIDFNPSALIEVA